MCTEEAFCDSIKRRMEDGTYGETRTDTESTQEKKEEERKQLEQSLNQNQPEKVVKEVGSDESD